MIGQSKDYDDDDGEKMFKDDWAWKIQKCAKGIFFSNSMQIT